MSGAELALLALGAVVAGFVQGLSGFAFSMVAMSFWVWGIAPQLAAVMAVFGSLTGQVVAAVTTRRPLRLAVLAPFLAGGLLGVPIGVWLLPHVNADLFRLALGVLLVLWCPLMLFSKSLPKLSGGRLGDGMSGTAGGVLGGIAGFTGVIPTLWCTLRGFDKDLQRTVIQNFNLATLAVSMATHVAAGHVTREMLFPMFAVVAPALLVPVLLGSRLYIGLSELAFRRLVLVLLTASGAVMLAAALPRLLR
jgi:uncharacterized membrane protein YfcA